MNSLKIKILGLITIIVVVIVTLTTLISYASKKHILTTIAEQDNALLADTIKSSINQAMRSGHSEEVRNILGRIKSQETISGLRIVDENGRILNSADPGEIGGTIPDPHILRAGKAVPLHAAEVEGTFESFTPIYNSPVCHKCHDTSQWVLGYLDIELSLGYMKAYIQKEKNITIVTTAIVICLIIVTISIFLISYVDKPIKTIISAMHQVEQGNFQAPPVITSSAEMQLLSRNFHNMTNRLKDLMDTTVHHERELARAQEKLTHHQEIHSINLKLEDKLIEIENLNIALEERIEEIEEANYKIADLAGDLEDKNTNLEKAVARLSTLNKVGLAINSTMEPDTLFELIVRTTMETMKAHIGYILMCDCQEKLFRVTTLIGYDEPWDPGTVIPMKSSSVSTWVIENRQPLLISDINEAPQFDRFSAIGYERKTLICAPLQVKDEIIGTITVVNKLDNAIYTSEDLELLTTIAAQASIAINNARLYEEQQQTYVNTIHALVSAIEASDSYTRGHSERVTRYSVELARKLNLAADRLNIIERAGILHDIGKIGINLSLLHKQGKLTPEDVHELRQHPSIGMKILEPIGFLHDVKLCIGQHHERYDGQGYPNRVSSENLLLESRILAIADAFDAMTSDRPYRKALPLEVAIKELRDNAGSQFDPGLVPHFVELLEAGVFASFYEPVPALSLTAALSDLRRPQVTIAPPPPSATSRPDQFVL